METATTTREKLDIPSFQTTLTVYLRKYQRSKSHEDRLVTLLIIQGKLGPFKKKIRAENQAYTLLDIILSSAGFDTNLVKVFLDYPEIPSAVLQKLEKEPFFTTQDLLLRVQAWNESLTQGDTIQSEIKVADSIRKDIASEKIKVDPEVLFDTLFSFMSRNISDPVYSIFAIRQISYKIDRTATLVLDANQQQILRISNDGQLKLIRFDQSFKVPNGQTLSDYIEPILWDNVWFIEPLDIFICGGTSSTSLLFCKINSVSNEMQVFHKHAIFDMALFSISLAWYDVNIGLIYVLASCKNCHAYKHHIYGLPESECNFGWHLFIFNSQDFSLIKCSTGNGHIRSAIYNGNDKKSAPLIAKIDKHIQISNYTLKIEIDIITGTAKVIQFDTYRSELQECRKTNNWNLPVDTEQMTNRKKFPNMKLLEYFYIYPHLLMQCLIKPFAFRNFGSGFQKVYIEKFESILKTILLSHPGMDFVSLYGDLMMYIQAIKWESSDPRIHESILRFLEIPLN